MSETKKGSYIKTHKIRLYTDYLEYFRLTNQVFNELIMIYYKIILKNKELIKYPPRKCRTEIEKMTLIDKKTGEIPDEYFEPDAPSRIRRAAIMQAIGQAQAYFTKLEKAQAEETKKTKIPGVADKFNIPTTLYKELYKYSNNRKIEIKLYNGKDWKWYESKLSKWDISENANLLSPRIEIHGNLVMLCIPEKCIIENITTIQERMKDENIRICGIAFSGKNNIATCVVVDRRGKFVKSLFVQGGNEYKYLTSQAMRKIKRNNHKAKNSEKIKGYNKKYWQKISRYRNHFSHVISKKIVDFCKENQVQIIALSSITNDEDYLKYAKNFNPITLRERIINYTKQKAFNNNILTTYVNMKDKSNKCYKCGELIERNIKKRTSKKIKEDKAMCKNRTSSRLLF